MDFSKLTLLVISGPNGGGNSTCIQTMLSVNRVLRTYTAGNSFVNAGHGVTNSFLTNSLTDSVRIWKVTDVANNLGKKFSKFDK